MSTQPYDEPLDLSIEPAGPQQRLAAARTAYHAALAKVHDAVITACPKPEDHHVVQHRDGKPPWCPHCGRNALGTQIKEWTP